MTAFRFFGIQSLDQYDQMTPKEFRLRAKALKYEQVDRRYWTSLQAFETVLAGGHKKNGQPVYRRLKDLFDYEQALKSLDNDYEPPLEDNIMQRVREFHRMKEAEHGGLHSKG